MDKKYRTWAEIDLAAIRHNIKNIQKLLQPDTRLMSIVKANAYGHGIVEVAKLCLEEGASFLGVAGVDEAMVLRKAGIASPILVLGHILPDYLESVVNYDITSTVFNLDSAQKLSALALKMGKTANVHIKLDTGMGRIGFLPDKTSVDIIETISKLPALRLEGIFTHFAVADAGDKTYTYQQIQFFKDMVEQLEEKGIHIPLKHTANSAAIVDLPQAHFNMVRAGIITYGLYPSQEVKTERLKLIPAMTLKSKITMIKNVKKGQSISYGRTFTSPKDMTVATVAAGYADGYTRLLSNRAQAVIRGHKVPLIGTICMDQCMFDISRVEEARVGDEVILFGRPEEGITAEDLANIIGTINYEVICSISARVPRIYI